MKSAADEIAARERLIVALDVRTESEAISLATQLSGAVGFFKIGLQLYTAAGPDIVRAITATGARVFLDLKLHDIPNTVARAVEAAAVLDVAMLTIHLAGGSAMIRAARGARPDGMTLLGVTVLTSSDTATLREVGVDSSVGAQVTRLAELGGNCGVDGIVASAHELPALRKLWPTALKMVIPGIRPSWSEPGDQKRFLTPAKAIAAGADYLVIGRPITTHANPREAVEEILAEIEA